MKAKIPVYVAFLFSLIMACDTESFRQGKQLYDLHCGNCHMEDGKGLGRLIPPLAQSDYLENRQNEIACIIRNGLKDSILVNDVVYNVPMEGIKNLSNTEICNIINYINQAWGNTIPFKSPVEVDEELKNCEKKYR